MRTLGKYTETSRNLSAAFKLLLYQFIWYQISGRLKIIGVNPYKVMWLERLRWDNKLFPEIPFRCSDTVCGKLTIFGFKRVEKRRYFFDGFWRTTRGFEFKCRKHQRFNHEQFLDYVRENQLFQRNPDAPVFAHLKDCDSCRKSVAI